MRLLKALFMAATLTPFAIAFAAILAVADHQATIDRERRAQEPNRYMGLPPAPDCRELRGEAWRACMNVSHKEKRP